jgi:hypothetical protein
VTEQRSKVHLREVEKIAKDIDIRPLRWTFMHMEGRQRRPDRTLEEA